MTVEGQLVAGRYRLVRSLGTGGMGRVWLAVDELLDRDVAVKEIVLQAEPSEAEQTRLHARAISEACAAARVCHHNVVQIHDVMRTDDGMWIVMEYVRGGSLRQMIVERGPLPPTQVALIGLSMLTALDAAHRKGVLHRDVKPSNVLVDPGGRVVLTDFGVATIGDVDADADADIVEGAPAYVAPERVLHGRSSVEGDLWSLGATLYAAVEGRPPFSRPGVADTLSAVATEPPDPVHRAGPLEPVLQGLLCRNPAIRMGSAQARRLLRAVAGENGAAAPQSESRALVSGGRAAPAAAYSLAGAEPATTTEPPSGTADSAPGVPELRPGRRRKAALIGTSIGCVIAVAVAAVLFQTSPLSGALPIARFQPATPPAPATTPRQGDTDAGLSQFAGGIGRFVLPRGWIWYEDAAGFRLAVPQGWTISRDDRGVYFKEPTGFRMLAVRQWKTSSTDPVAAWSGEEAEARRLTNYQRIRIEDVPQYFTSCSDWEYRYDVDRRQLHTLERGFTTPRGRSFAFSWRATEFDWPINQSNFLLVAASFRAD